MLKLKLDRCIYECVNIYKLDFTFSVTQRYNHLDQRRDYSDNNKLH